MLVLFVFFLVTYREIKHRETEREREFCTGIIFWASSWTFSGDWCCNDKSAPARMIKGSNSFRSVCGERTNVTMIQRQKEKKEEYMGLWGGGARREIVKWKRDPVKMNWQTNIWVNKLYILLNGQKIVQDENHASRQIRQVWDKLSCSSDRENTDHSTEWQELRQADRLTDMRTGTETDREKGR